MIFYYMEGELENTSNKLVYLVPQKIFLKENRKILQRILEMLLLVIGFTVCTMLYFSKRIAKPLVEVAQTLEKSSQWNGSSGRTSRLFSGDE